MSSQKDIHGGQVEQLVLWATGRSNPYVRVPLEPAGALTILGPLYDRVLTVYKGYLEDPASVRACWDSLEEAAVDDILEDKWAAIGAHHLWDAAQVCTAVETHDLAGVGAISVALPCAADDETVTFCDQDMVKDIIVPCLLAMGLGCPRPVPVS